MWWSMALKVNTQNRSNNSKLITNTTTNVAYYVPIRNSCNCVSRFPARSFPPVCACALVNILALHVYICLVFHFFSLRLCVCIKCSLSTQQNARRILVVWIELSRRLEVKLFERVYLQLPTNPNNRSSFVKNHLTLSSITSKRRKKKKKSKFKQSAILQQIIR